MSQMVVMKVDASPEIGSGHMVRCVAIAQELHKMGDEVCFAVSAETSKAYAARFGIKVHILPGNPMHLEKIDGEALGQLCIELHASAVLVDTYGVTDRFFSGLRRTVSTTVRIAYIDDCFTYADGALGRPKPWNTDLLINYGSYWSEKDYEDIYTDTTKLLLGLKYAPIRPEFKSKVYKVRRSIDRILITSGSTNPNRSIERMIEGVLQASVAKRISVVVGNQCKDNCFVSDYSGIDYLYDVNDMATLMDMADLVVSAAGTTLFELCCIGTPTVALPVVENQIPNASWFSRKELGCAVNTLDWTPMDIHLMVDNMRQISTRTNFSRSMRQAVDGYGTERIAAELTSLG